MPTLRTTQTIEAASYNIQWNVPTILPSPIQQPLSQQPRFQQLPLPPPFQGFPPLLPPPPFTPAAPISVHPSTFSPRPSQPSFWSSSTSSAQQTMPFGSDRPLSPSSFFCDDELDQGAKRKSLRRDGMLNLSETEEVGADFGSFPGFE